MFLFPSHVPAGPVVNDGGLSWLRKNYQRMKEQAEREQRSLDDVVAERYGVSADGTRRTQSHRCTCPCPGMLPLFVTFISAVNVFICLSFCSRWKNFSSDLQRRSRLCMGRGEEEKKEAAGGKEKWRPRRDGGDMRETRQRGIAGEEMNGKETRHLETNLLTEGRNENGEAIETGNGGTTETETEGTEGRKGRRMETAKETGARTGTERETDGSIGTEIESEPEVKTDPVCHRQKAPSPWAL